MSLTRHRNLRTGDSVWSAYRHPVIRSARLRRSVTTDVVVVGAGISGALISYVLTQAGRKPLIIDRRREALLGSTAASTALLQFELDVPLIKLGRKLGKRRAEKIWVCSHAAVNELRTQAQRLGVEAHLKSRPSLYLAGSVLNAAGLTREVKARQRLGLPSELLSGKALRHHFDIDRAGAILSHGNAEADPVSLASGFLGAAIRGGARLHAPHDLTELHATKKATTLVTRDGIEIKARHVVLCTGYELADIVPAVNTNVLSTWAIATRPQPAKLWPQRALIWESSDPYLYLRTTHDGRVLCGGEDEEFADEVERDALISQKARRLQEKLHRLFPRLDARPEFAWAGAFGSSTTGAPTIGEIPDFPRCYAVMGYGGNGITFSMLAAGLIRNAILKKKDPDRKLFEFPNS